VTLLEAALSYAARGWHVFPLHGIVDGACTCSYGECSSPGKHPRVRHGLHEATTDPDRITRWWRRWPDANIGIATGTGSGVVVVDIDLRHHPDELHVFASMASLLDRGLPVTLTSLTGGGGLHLFYASSDEDLGNTAGRLPGIDGELPGIDLRANGGYVVAPPSAHRIGTFYKWLDANRSIARAPEWLKQPPQPVVNLENIPAAEFDGDGTPYGLAVLRDELDLVRTAREGTRNDQLNRSAFALAQLVAGGELDESVARRSIQAAGCSIGLKDLECHQTIESAFRAGTQSPRVAPHRRRARVSQSLTVRHQVTRGSYATDQLGVSRTGLQSPLGET
jgi:hypothetical protein